jgi:DNA modification methylase
MGQPADGFDGLMSGAEPPYCAGGFTEGGRTTANGAMGVAAFDWFQGDNMTTPGLVWLLRRVAIEAHRVLVNKGSLCIFCDWRMIAMLAPALESSGLRWRNLVVWDKLVPGLGTGSFRARHELVLHFLKGASVPRYANNVGNAAPCRGFNRPEPRFARRAVPIPPPGPP